MCKNFKMAVLAVLAAALTGCGQVGEGDASDTEPLFTTTEALTRQNVHTTKTAVYIGGEIDSDDEDLEGGYTTTTSITGSLENTEIDNPDNDVDEELRATQRTDAKTFYSIPEHNGTTAAAVTVSEPMTTTTRKATVNVEDAPDVTATTVTTTTKTTTETTVTTTSKYSSLYTLQAGMRYKSEKKYKVVSDTTYLNLRFGPSKQYDVRLQIPDGDNISGWGETVGEDGNIWVYTSYNSTPGWVMKDLLEERS